MVRRLPFWSIAILLAALHIGVYAAVTAVFHLPLDSILNNLLTVGLMFSMIFWLYVAKDYAKATR